MIFTEMEMSPRWLFNRNRLCWWLLMPHHLLPDFDTSSDKQVAVSFPCEFYRPHTDSSHYCDVIMGTMVSGEFPAQRVSNAENVSIWWRHIRCWWILFGSSAYVAALHPLHMTWPLALGSYYRDFKCIVFKLLTQNNSFRHSLWMRSQHRFM